MWLKWFPWKFVISRIARSRGFLDPIALLSRLNRFAQPSEVAEPIELLRAGALFHARGLINSRVIQHNLDWVWPYWVERQFDPRDISFVPRAFSITHVNLTHRNWTAIGLPDGEELPIVDPRGLVTPFIDGWSLDFWIMAEDGQVLLPSREKLAEQYLDLGENIAVENSTRHQGLTMSNRAEVIATDNKQVCRIRMNASADRDAWAIVALRPYNPEGISFIQQIAISADHRRWSINKDYHVVFNEPADRHRMSSYRAGDVYIHLQDAADQASVKCDVGMATAAAMFRLKPNVNRSITTDIPLGEWSANAPDSNRAWTDALHNHCALRIADKHMQFIYDAAIRTLILHSPGDVYPGPYTYKRFWFRDAAFIIHGLLNAGMTDRAERAIDRFPDRQNMLGYFHSQDGEWDSNGEALWIMNRFCEMTARPVKQDWYPSIINGARWIIRKRLDDGDNTPHAGLLPAGFSAEHLGPNDYYYWDDFWGVAGLYAAAQLAGRKGDIQTGRNFNREGDGFMQAIERSLEKVAAKLGRAAIPASPYRRLDAGAIGSVAVGYPLSLCQPCDPRLLDTVEFLLKNCFLDGGFFQDMIHSGINAYLTLHIAQVLLRAGDPRYLELMGAVADLASSTGQWPEAIHPHTHGGCMGDGQHVWAAAEWVIMIRNCFVREEGDRLLLGTGIAQQWLDKNEPVLYGPAPTSFGTISLSFTFSGNRLTVSWQAAWHKTAPPIEVNIPGFSPVIAAPGKDSVVLEKLTSP